MKAEFESALVVERDSTGTALSASLHPLLQRIYRGRCVTTAAELDYRLSQLPHYTGLKDIDRATGMLAQAILHDQPIIIVGDFDADGATSTALILDVLASLGAHADYFIPNRMAHGYGLSPCVVTAIGAPATAPGVLVTVDNGIAAHEGVKAAQAAGWQVIVTDHHLPGESLPPAQAIVNPNQPDCSFTGKNLAGVGVVFYLMLALRARMADLGWQKLPRMSDHLDLVAVGTVADVVTLDWLNRILVSQGLRRLQAGRGRPGLVALAEIAGRDPGRLDTDDIGFAVAPRLNAAGRMEDMRVGVSCLRAASWDEARQRAEELSAINSQRRAVQKRMQEQAEAALAAMQTPEQLPAALCVHQADWHEGIVGLVASRLCENIQRPVIAFAKSGAGRLKGSARSIPGLHIRDVLAAVQASRPGIIEQFGGHAQAAGLTLQADKLDELSRMLDEIVAQRLTPAMISRQFWTDGELQPEEHCLDVAHLLRAAGPWGAGFEPPLFHGVYRLLRQRIVGGHHLKMEVCPSQGGEPIEAMFFNHDQWLDEQQLYRLIFRLQVNEFRGRQTANLIVQHCCIDRPGLVASQADVSA